MKFESKMNLLQYTATVSHIKYHAAIEFFAEACHFKKRHKVVPLLSNSAPRGRNLPGSETDPPPPKSIISEIFGGVQCMLVPLDVSFLFLLACRCGLCYDSAKANRLRNGEMCQSTQCCKMFLKGCSDVNLWKDRSLDYNFTSRHLSQS